MLKKLSLLTFGIATLSATPAMAYNCSKASYYGTPSDGYGYVSGRLITASGERFVPSRMTTAHRYLPFGTKLKVVNQTNGKSVIVRVNDRGPFVGGRSLDLSFGAFSAIENTSRGTTTICYYQV